MQAVSVRGILREIEAGGIGKTQTRRLLSIRGHRSFSEFGRSDTPGYDWHFRDAEMRWHDLRHCELLRSLAYQKGDHLYVREHWRVSKRYDATPPRDLAPRSMTVMFEAGGSIANQDSRNDWRPSDWHTEPHGEIPDWMGRFRHRMHLPRWASRITLIVAEVRVQRLHDISETDAIAEGIEPMEDGRYSNGGLFRNYVGPGSGIPPIDSYRTMWESIHGVATWEANPWVAVTQFEPVLANVHSLSVMTE